VQRDRSFRDEIDAGKRVRYRTGLKKAQDFQLELNRNKRAQGKTYVDPAAGNELFGPAAEASIAKSPAIEAGQESRRAYLSNYRNSLRPVFAGRTLAQMASQAAADEAAQLQIAGRQGQMTRNTARYAHPPQKTGDPESAGIMPGTAPIPPRPKPRHVSTTMPAAPIRACNAHARIHATRRQ
jgi:hypothetical protein